MVFDVHFMISDVLNMDFFYIFLKFMMNLRAPRKKNAKNP